MNYDLEETTRWNNPRIQKKAEDFLIKKFWNHETEQSEKQTNTFRCEQWENTLTQDNYLECIMENTEKKEKKSCILVYTHRTTDLEQSKKDKKRSKKYNRIN